ncbi:response regulator [Maribellus comscasis]|jgi:CheY-like chemotaxis protein|uniref:histidine kinase n=1 Tax=Maribellus comscasis TaxID=2681766 RepID=A0A6I6JVA2_9BACT|nr:ATP-binding protein [Maribellus comscasis]QGY46481.1 response regulator [Maribellus comscasis]
MKVLNSETNLNEVMEYIYYFFKEEVEGKGINLLYEQGLSSKEVTVYSDQNKIIAILINLIKNAIKFTERGSIKFGYEKKGETLIFFVKDTGVGIDEEQKNIIFERFERVSTKLMVDNSGNGFGLSISKAYVELFGGRIWVESEFGQGSSFYFTIPYDSVKKEQNNLLQKPVVSTRYLKILIAEDNEISEKLIRKLLGKFAREIITVKSGIEAVDSCQNNPDIDLIIMDIRMPEMNGYEATRQIRLFNSEVIIVAQTAIAFDIEREKAIDAGCDDFISKPFPSNVFERLLKKHFELT